MTYTFGHSHLSAHSRVLKLLILLKGRFEIRLFTTYHENNNFKSCYETNTVYVLSLHEIKSNRWFLSRYYISVFLLHIFSSFFSLSLSII